ncbi:Protein GVQW3 [Formica fusca]
MLKKAFGDDTMSQPRVYEWYKRFQEGREDIEDDARSGRPSTSTSHENVEKVKEIVLANILANIIAIIY